jgi:Na+/H+ antiporter NhaA
MFKKLFSRIIFLLFFLIVIIFSFSNSGSVLIGIWPLNNRIEIPLFFLIIVSLTIGVFIGILFSLYTRLNRR